MPRRNTPCVPGAFDETDTAVESLLLALRDVKEML
jgi:hypothetical protein